MAGRMKKRKLVDERFEEVFTEPRYDTLPKKEKKVIIDQRFKDVLKSRKFQGKCEIDMRGRKIDIVNNDFKNLYELDDAAKGSSSEDEAEEIKLDLARGLGNITSSDEDTSEDSSEDEVIQSPEYEHNWGETDRDAERIDWSSKRLALCNMDWDQLSAADLYALISSFKPPSPSEVLSVKIYLSDFGKNRVEMEERHGPTLPGLNKSIDDNSEINEKTREAIRLYQLERMRYYYAIIDCDTVETASAIYESCDGFEFENSALRLDLRFVPDDMTFEETRIKDEVTSEVSKLYRFKPKQLENNAATLTNAKITWDQTDPKRVKTLKGAFNPDADLDDFRDYLAPCSSDESESNARELLGEVEGRSSQENDELEVTWEPTVESAELSSSNKKDEKTKTNWEKYLEKRKAKRKERKKLIAELKKQRKAERNEEETVKPEKVENIVKTHKKKTSEQIDDGRFASLYTNSAFAIDQTSSLSKNSRLLQKQVAEKRHILDNAFSK